MAVVFVPFSKFTKFGTNKHEHTQVTNRDLGLRQIQQFKYCKGEEGQNALWTMSNIENYLLSLGTPPENLKVITSYFAGCCSESGFFYWNCDKHTHWGGAA
jgi:hypothetical protein